MSHVRIFDTTLRDGEQSPGFSMNTQEKIRMARQLAALGVDTIEAGFPIASKGDLDAVIAVSTEVRDVPVAALARARKDDILAAAEASKPAKTPRMHVFLATSDLHLNVKLHMTREHALEAIESMVKLAKNFVEEVEFSAEDAGRTDIEFLCWLARLPYEAGPQCSICPIRSATRCRKSMGRCSATCASTRAIHHIILSAHCHDDLGLAVANSWRRSKPACGKSSAP